MLYEYSIHSVVNFTFKLTYISFSLPQARSEEQLACEKEWLQAGHMWLAHRGGFTAVMREGEADPGRAKVRVLQTGEVITVDEDDLEKVSDFFLKGFQLNWCYFVFTHNTFR